MSANHGRTYAEIAASGSTVHPIDETILPDAPTEEEPFPALPGN